MRKLSLIPWVFLAALSHLYGLITRARNYLYDRGVLRSYCSSLPVVSIGNLTVGGNGKTPLCLYLVEALREKGFSPVILSRGYGGRAKGPHLVQRTDTPELVGDEPLLMALSGGGPVVVARDRAQGARYIEREKLGDVIVLDDGFQHRRLARQVDIISAFVGGDESIEAFVEGRLLPLGRFREDRDAGLRRATVCVASYRSVMSAGEEMPVVDGRVLSLVPSGVPVFRAAYEWIGVRSLLDGAAIFPRPVHAFAGIANPEGFFNSLERTGFSVVKRFQFPDHHAFSEEEVLKIVDAHPDALFVCTEKDGVKIRRMSERVRSVFAEYSVRLKVVPSDAFAVAILRAIQRG